VKLVEPLLLPVAVVEPLPATPLPELALPELALPEPAIPEPLDDEDPLLPLDPLDDALPLPPEKSPLDELDPLEPWPFPLAPWSSGAPDPEVAHADASKQTNPAIAGAKHLRAFCMFSPTASSRPSA
jgi:hypothetical protein